MGIGLPVPRSVIGHFLGHGGSHFRLRASIPSLSSMEFVPLPYLDNRRTWGWNMCGRISVKGQLEDG